MEVTMISCGVEISIAGGVAETEDANYGDLFYSFLFFFFIFYIMYSLLKYKNSIILRLLYTPGD